ncbi:DsbA family oxidoreductase [Altererythrobacter sp. MF3-039]|uniref:DsbA family oxidoreductase n=1 Tax=Altererythrobacter sp. MF3-039 TaxID=3252901 RepID=UPI00390C7D17
MTETSPRKLTIDIWSDVMCPWCLVGHGQLAKGLKELEGEIEAEIRWRPFELNPDMPAEGEEQGAHLRKKYRRTEEEGKAMRDRMRQIAESAGVSLDYKGEDPSQPAMMRNTFLAHKLLAHVLDSYGGDKQTELKLALFEAHFNQRRDVGDREVLLGIAEDHGVLRGAAERALDDEDLGQRVRAEEQAAYEMNITGVPAMVIEGKFLIPGAQEPATYVNALRRVAERFPA